MNKEYKKSVRQLVDFKTYEEYKNNYKKIVTKELKEKMEKEVMNTLGRKENWKLEAEGIEDSMVIYEERV